MNGKREEIHIFQQQFSHKKLWFVSSPNSLIQRFGAISFEAVINTIHLIPEYI